MNAAEEQGAAGTLEEAEVAMLELCFGEAPMEEEAGDMLELCFGETPMEEEAGDSDVIVVKYFPCDFCGEQVEREDLKTHVDKECWMS